VKGFEKNKVGRCLEVYHNIQCGEWGVWVGVIASFPPVRECKRDEVVLTKGDVRTILRVGEAVAKNTKDPHVHTP
jgi:hypothetical protein